MSVITDSSGHDHLVGCPRKNDVGPDAVPWLIGRRRKTPEIQDADDQLPRRTAASDTANIPGDGCARRSAPGRKRVHALGVGGASERAPERARRRIVVSARKTSQRLSGPTRVRAMISSIVPYAMPSRGARRGASCKQILPPKKNEEVRAQDYRAPPPRPAP